jgi:AcrR family transcriptional regulator
LTGPEEFPGLDAAQGRALAALLSCTTIAEAAKKVRLSEATLYRYLRDETFSAAYRRARADVVDHAITQLQRDCATASKTLREVCEDKGAPASARVAAARIILDGAVRAVELQDLGARVEALEAAQREGAGDESRKKG